MMGKIIPPIEPPMVLTDVAIPLLLKNQVATVPIKGVIKIPVPSPLHTENAKMNCQTELQFANAKRPPEYMTVPVHIKPILPFLSK